MRTCRGPWAGTRERAARSLIEAGRPDQAALLEGIEEGRERPLRRLARDGLQQLGLPRGKGEAPARRRVFFRDGLGHVLDEHAQVLGISAQDVGSHDAFASKHGFEFPLLADTDKRVAPDRIQHA